MCICKCLVVVPVQRLNLAGYGTLISTLAVKCEKKIVCQVFGVLNLYAALVLSGFLVR